VRPPEAAVPDDAVPDDAVPDDAVPDTGTRDRVLLGVLIAVQLAVLYWPLAAGNPGVVPLDKLVHVTVFGLVAWAAIRAGVPTGWTVGLLLGHAVISEFVQAALLPHRSGDPLDAVADAVGVLLGVATARRAGRRQRAGRRSQEGVHGR
jgi:hypothetical protein